MNVNTIEHVQNCTCRPTLYFFIFPNIEFNKEGNAWAMSLCTNDTWSGTFTYIDNEPLALIKQTYTKETDCMCALTIPANEEIALQAPYLYKKPKPMFDCSQNVMVWDDAGYSHTYCSKQNEYTVFGCSDKERRVLVRYNTDDTNIGTIFMLALRGWFH